MTELTGWLSSCSLCVSCAYKKSEKVLKEINPQHLLFTRYI